MRGPSPRLSAWATRASKKNRSDGDTGSDLTGPGIETTTFHIAGDASNHYEKKNYQIRIHVFNKNIAYKRVHIIFTTAAVEITNHLSINNSYYKKLSLNQSNIAPQHYILQLRWPLLEL